MVRPSCRDAMLDAAEVLLSEQGAWRLTLGKGNFEWKR